MIDVCDKDAMSLRFQHANVNVYVRHMDVKFLNFFVYSLLFLECHSISNFNSNLIGHFAVKLGKTDLQKEINN